MTNLLQKTMAGHKECNRPRLIGEVILDSHVSNSPLARGYRKYLASKENAEKGGMKHE